MLRGLQPENGCAGRRHPDAMFPPADGVERTRGPLRPVKPITDEDEQLLRHALAAAGRKAVYTVAVAVQPRRDRGEGHDLRRSFNGSAGAPWRDLVVRHAESAG